jgi:peroxiredoxin
MKSMIGEPAIPFELKDTDGNIHRLEDGSGHWQLLVFHRHLG